MLNLAKHLLRVFLRDTTIDGLKLFLFNVSFRYAKTLWIVFMTVIISYAHIIIVNLTIEYLESPTEIHMSTTLVHVANSPFVGVGICSANKISKRKLQAYAEKVFECQQNYRPDYLANTTVDMENFLLLLVGFYVFPYDNYESGDVRLRKLHDILTRFYNTSDYPSREILRDLAPDCNELIVRGMIYGKIIDTDQIFIKRMTSLSACCMFNYKRESYTNDPKSREQETAFAMDQDDVKFEANSILNSVQFVLQDDPDDFTYRYLSNNAFQVILFPATDYATIQSNSAGEILVGYNSIVEIPVQPLFKESSKRIQQFKPDIRNCYYPEEGAKLLNRSYYSQDECLLICRMRSMVNHCGCVNPSMPGDIINATACNLLDLPCLTQWKRIWYDWNFFDYVTSKEDKLEQHEKYTKSSRKTQRCDLCYPTCDVITFQIYNNVLPLIKAINGHTYQSGLLTNISDAKPMAIIKLYFKQRFAFATEEDITGDWVILLNRFGGIMSLMFGFSMISIIDICYFLSGKWFIYFYKACQMKRKLSSPTAMEKFISTQEMNITLYWNEIKQKKVVADNQFRDAVALHSYVSKNKVKAFSGTFEN